MNDEDKIVEYLARMCIIIIFGLVIATILTLCSCTRTIYVPQVSVERDSIYLHTHTRDSIMVHDSVTIMIKGDTVWQTAVRYEYKDTVNELRSHLKEANNQVQHLQEELDEYMLQNQILKDEATKLLDKNDNLNEVVSELSTY